MPELTRLRRDIRGSSGNWFGDLESLLDATDRFYEDIEVIERDLSNYPSLDEESVRVTVQKNASRLIKAIGSLGGVDEYKMLSWLVESWGLIGMNTLEDAYTRLRAQHDASQEGQETLGDLDDHPF